MSPGRRKSHGWVVIIWVINGLALFSLLVFLFFYFSRAGLRVSAAVDSTRTPAPAEARTIPPTSYFLPTLTPNPHYTPPVFESPTPFALAYGPRPSIIGFSVGGRPIEVYTFGNGEKQYLIVAGIHGGYEGNTIALANELIPYIIDNPDVISADTTLYIIRDMNPDAEARSNDEDGRVNNHGVDLNRNFPSDNWTADWDRDGCWVLRPTKGGDYGGSEPETRAVMNFIASHQIRALISYHSAALGIFPGGTPWEPASIRLAGKLGKATGYPYPPVDTGCKYTGTLADWAVENGARAAVDMELSTHKSTDFDNNLRALEVLLNFVP
jgi:murein peptide amidase A